VDFIVPAVLGLITLFTSEADAVGVKLGEALLIFASTLAIIGMVVFPIRHYRRRRNPYRVARNLVVANVVLALVAAVGAFFAAKSLTEEGEKVGDVRVELAFGLVLIGFLLAAASFLIFLLLSKFRARKAYQEGMVRL
jgi:hypothetical protein